MARYRKVSLEEKEWLETKEQNQKSLVSWKPMEKGAQRRKERSINAAEKVLCAEDWKYMYMLKLNFYY